MKATWYSTVLLSVVLSGGTLLQAQTASELLQKGIYTQETVGDLDSAMQIYRQVIQLSGESRAAAAQAQYRLGVCLLKKGQQTEAAKTFEKLIEQYPDQAETVAKARELMPGPFKLLPVPWADGEALEYNITMGAMNIPGANAPGSILKIRYSFRSSRANPGHWVFETRMLNPVMQFVESAEADGATLKPFTSKSSNPVMGDVHVTYEGALARIETAGKASRTVAIDATVFDYDEMMALVRRLPLAPGFKAQVGIIQGASGVVMKTDLAVTGEEDVETPAGKFHCFKVELSVLNSTYWVSTDPSRYVAKFDATVMTGQLAIVRRLDTAGPSTYRDDKLGFSLTTPEGWTADRFDFVSDGSATVQLVDPDTSALMTVLVKAAKPTHQFVVTAPKGTADVEPAKPVEPVTEASLRKQAESFDPMSAMGTSKAREDSWQPRQVGGHMALGWISDSTDMFKRKTVDYKVLVNSGALSAQLTLKADPAEFEALRTRFEQVVDSLTLR